MSVSDTLIKISDEIKDLFRTIVETKVKVESVDKTVDSIKLEQKEFIIVQRQLLESLSQKVSEMDKRINAVEGMTEAVFRESLKEALMSLGREHLNKHGTLAGFDPATQVESRKLMGE